jgi:hypothetical protein
MQVCADCCPPEHDDPSEGIKVGNQTAEAIQKIIGAPILHDGRVVGILQISRKGADAMNAGPDFSSSDPEKVLALCKPLGKLLSRLTAEAAQ